MASEVSKNAVGASSEAVERLEALARAATPGPWKACGTIYEYMNCEVRGGAKGEGQAIAQVWDGPNAFKDGQFIAAANPETILALTELIRSQAEALGVIADVWGLPSVDPLPSRKWHCQHEESLFAAIKVARAALTPEVKS